MQILVVVGFLIQNVESRLRGKPLNLATAIIFLPDRKPVPPAQ
jgi:hypothetical protein